MSQLHDMNPTDYERGYERGYEKGYAEGKRDAVKHGEWLGLEKTNRMLGNCSVCGTRCCGVDQCHFCPNCGAKMDGEPPKEEKQDG